MRSFTHLVRFLAFDGRTYYGNAILPAGVTDIAKAEQAHLITGDVFSKHDVTNRAVKIKHLLSPLAPEQSRTVRCLGLNYLSHAQEMNTTIPEWPIVFLKPQTSIAGPLDPVPITAAAQTVPLLDWETELVIVIGKRCSEVPEARAVSECVLGYSVGNDVSHRDWQIFKGGGQWSLGKGFDGWAPYGPGIVSPSVVGDVQRLNISARVNGVTMQDANTSDMFFKVPYLVSFLSKMSTLLPGDLIFTGTPSGVGAGHRPMIWLKDGDVVEVELQGVGVCTNKMVFKK